MKNHLADQSSPYLLQHSENPVDWYPWGEEAFLKAKREDKPVFLSIGYSTCHWCHVMAHESFEDEAVAALLNRYFISIKVDREERPDIDSAYMPVCQAFTGSGGWPASIFMTPDQKPFFAGTYFPPKARVGLPGFMDLLFTIKDRWQKDREALLSSAQEITLLFSKQQKEERKAEFSLAEEAAAVLKSSFDDRFGGFGRSPKFPMPCDLLFLLAYSQKTEDSQILSMVEKNLRQMYRGGIFDHIGYGFCRYSTDRYFLVPHFEKMLYDNALLILTYTEAFFITQNEFYKKVAEKTADYLLREMAAPEGAFFSAQDADSAGGEGRYYVFEPREILDVLGTEEGRSFCRNYCVIPEGNFEGRSIPNLLGADSQEASKETLEKLYRYRCRRMELQTDKKILTAWNALTIAALARLYRASGDERYGSAAKECAAFLNAELYRKGTLFHGSCEGILSGKGFLDDYAFTAFALLEMYETFFIQDYLVQALDLCTKVISDFSDAEYGGFYFSGKEERELIFETKEFYDGAVPSGNSVMAYNLVKLSLLFEDRDIERKAQEQLYACAGRAGTGQSFYYLALLMKEFPPAHVTVVLKQTEELEKLKKKFRHDELVTVLFEPSEAYPLLNDKTTFYVCRNFSCRPPVNEL